MSKILTPEEFIIREVNKFPALYASDSYDETKFRIFDHVFNVIGNGLFTESFIGEPVTQDEIQQAQKWFNCKRAGYGYKDVIEVPYRGKTRIVPDPDKNEQYIVAPIEEFNNHPEINLWIEFACDEAKVPYPNFDKKYSLVWDDNMLDSCDKSWIKAAGWFYSKCHDFFLDDSRVSQYYYAFPTGNLNQDKKRIESFKKNMSFEKCPTNDDISKAYGCEFIGDRNNDDDVSNFIAKRWQQELQEILNFIGETISKLNAML